MRDKLKIFLWILIMGTSCHAQFGSRQIIDQNSGTVRMVRTADFDQDGALDVAVSSFDRIALYKNLDGLGTFSAPISIQEGKKQSFSLFPADIDNDGKIDLAVSFFDDDEVVWYRNLGNGTFSALQLISNNLLRAAGITGADLDGDGDLDLVLGVSNGNGLYWVENLDGAGTFSSRITIDANISQARTQAIGDIDGDGDMDILTNSVGSAYLSWFENVDGLGDFNEQHIIDPIGLYENSLSLVDIDGDNDLDIVSQKTDLVIWRENLNGLGQFDYYNIISNEALNIFDTTSADLDNDGDVDVLSASTDDNKIAWYRNEDGMGGFGPQNIIDPNLQSPRTVHAADLDNDGDLDILSAALSNQNRELVWYENLTILGVEGSELETNVTLYPNPVINTLQLNTQEKTIDQINIYTITGSNVLQLEVNTVSPTVDVSSLASGVYYIQVYSGKDVALKKFLKE